MSKNSKLFIYTFSLAMQVVKKVLVWQKNPPFDKMKLVCQPIKNQMEDFHMS